MKPPIRFNAFTMNTVSHQSPGLWTHPMDVSLRYRTPTYWTDLAKLLEKGLFDAVFLADVLGIYDVYGQSPDAAIEHAIQAPSNDPFLVIPVMSQVTKHLGFGATFSLTYEHPYPFARRMSTLDHLTHGRVGWNIVTGYLDSAARNFGMARQMAHDARYDYADEYMQVVYKLWNCSWEPGAVVCDTVNKRFADPSKVHSINHQGTHFNVPGIHLCEPSLQRTPVLFQAGTSERGLVFSGQHAECVFLCMPTLAGLTRAAEGVRRSVAEAGRNPKDVLIYGQALIITDTTDEAARAKYEDYCDYIDMEGAKTLLSGWTGVDFSRYADDATVEYMDTDAGRTALASFSKADPTQTWTVGRAARFVALGGRGPILVGSASTVCDQLEAWVDASGIDGFNLAYAVAHETFRDVVELIVPELQRRGRYRTAYPSGTLRDKLFGQGPLLPPRHPGAKTRITPAS